jgi:hypothetical protein
MTKETKDQLHNGRQCIDNGPNAARQLEFESNSNLEKFIDEAGILEDKVADKVSGIIDHARKENHPELGPYEIPGATGLAEFNPIGQGLVETMVEEDTSEKAVAN